MASTRTTAASSRCRRMARACWARSTSRASCATRSREHARFDWDEYREVVKVFTRMLDNVVEVNGLPLRAAARRDHAQAPPRHGLPRPGLAPSRCSGMKYGSPESVQVHRGRLARDGGGRLGSGARAGEGEGPRADHERGVRRSPPRCCASARRWRRTAGRSATRIPGRVLHARYSRYMQRVAEVAPRARGRSSPKSARASRTTARSRRPARSRCRSPTTPATASSRRSRITTSAT